MPLFKVIKGKQMLVFPYISGDLNAIFSTLVTISGGRE